MDKGLLVCLNLTAQNSRLYWLTDEGHQILKKLSHSQKQSYQKPVLANIDWPLYGQICYRHRSAVMKALTGPMQPSEVKRVLRIQRSDIRISSGNIRDIILFFLSKGIVGPVKIRKKAFLRYELTDLGIKFRRLLIQADTAL